MYDTKRRSLTKIEDVLAFDPYMKLGQCFIRKLYVQDNLSRGLSQDVLLELSQCYPDKHDYFAKILLDHYIPRRRYGIACVAKLQLLVCEHCIGNW